LILHARFRRGFGLVVDAPRSRRSQRVHFLRSRPARRSKSGRSRPAGGAVWPRARGSCASVLIRGPDGAGPGRSAAFAPEFAPEM